MAAQKSHTSRIVAFVGKPIFFRLIMGLFVLQALWIALSGLYPMAFDEDFHLGIISIYAHHISPFLAAQPEGSAQFGAVARDPSYMYQYLMSFPYRLIGLFTNDQTVRVLILRFLDIGLFAWGLVLFRRLMLRTGASRAIVHVCLLVLVLLPVTPLLAAQINYDNLFFPLVALALLWAADLASTIGKRRMDAALVLRLTMLCLFTSLVKYAFLPIFAVIALYLALKAVSMFGSWKELRSAFMISLRSASKLAVTLLLVGLAVSGLLFAQRYVVNALRYHTPVPACDKVLSVDECSAYGPWARDRHYKQTKTGTDHNPVIFMGDWLYGMWLRTFFAVDGPGTRYQTRGPLLFPGISAIIFTVSGMVLVAVYGKRVFRRYGGSALTLMALASFFYVAVLWLDNFAAYVSTGQPVAINGRYLLPVMLPLLLIGALSAGECLRGQEKAKMAVAALGVLSLLWGGGALTYILRSNDAWYRDNAAVRSANHAVQDTLGPITPGYYQPGEFLR